MSDIGHWILRPNWPKLPLSMNDHLIRPATARIEKNIRETVGWAARAAKIPPLVHAHVVMIWTVPTKGRRDIENPVATYKPGCDGLVDAGVVPDDTPEWMTKVMPVIEYQKGVEAVRFEVTGIPSRDNSGTRRGCRVEIEEIAQ